MITVINLFISFVLLISLMAFLFVGNIGMAFVMLFGMILNLMVSVINFAVNIKKWREREDV